MKMKKALWKMRQRNAYFMAAKLDGKGSENYITSWHCVTAIKKGTV